jgi:hypothetical protein
MLTLKFNMMKNFIVCSLAFGLLATGCNSEAKKPAVGASAAATAQQLAESKKNAREVEALNQDYLEIPDEKLLENNATTRPVYKELQERYKAHMVKLKKEVEDCGAKFIVVLITPEVGQGLSDFSRLGNPFIRATCSNLGIEFYDFSPAIAKQNVDVITQAPLDGHWSKKGAIFLADQFEPIIKKHLDHKTPSRYKDEERPETFGDLEPSSEEILDGGKNLPYKLVSNAQGLRMDHDIKFPKTKQHILFLGGSQIYSPFLDNEFIATTILARRFPDVEMMNAAMISGCTDDFVSLWEDKAKYSEPDVVIVQTNGTDIPDLFFSNRNHLARSKKPYYPSPVEEKYFMERYRR